MEAYLILETYNMLPSQYLGLNPDDIDHEAERAFLLACAMTTAENRKKAMEKAKRK